MEAKSTPENARKTIDYYFEYLIFSIKNTSEIYVQNIGTYWILDTGYWILDAGCWMLDAACYMCDARFKLRVVGGKSSKLKAECSKLKAESSKQNVSGIGRFSAFGVRLKEKGDNFIVDIN